MNTISKLASNIKDGKDDVALLYNRNRLIVTLDKFNEDFKYVIPELLTCNLTYEPCFLYKRTNMDSNYYLFPYEKIHEGSVCTCNSILFIFEHNGKKIQKRLFYDRFNDKGWFYIAENGSCANDNIYLKNLRKDLILYLDGTFKGEYL